MMIRIGIEGLTERKGGPVVLVSHEFAGMEPPSELPTKQVSIEKKKKKRKERK